MIRLERTRTKTAIAAKYRGPKRVEAEQKLIDAAHKPDTGFWTTAKKQLKREAAGKCGYCEASTAVVAHGDVEHFRPKSVYWWLAYCYDNYVYACQICNQTYKGDKFPVAGARLRPPAVPEVAGTFAPDPLDAQAVAAFVALCRAERAGIPDPYNDEPETIFAWFADPVLKEVEVRPRDAKAETVRRFKAADRFLGLNRDELRRVRYTIYRPASVISRSVLSGRLDAASQAEAEDELRAMLAGDHQFAGMLRYFVRDVWQVPL